MEKSDSNIGLFFTPIHALTRAKVQRRMSEGSAKESRRAGTAEYVTKVQRRMSEGSAKDKTHSQFKFQNPKIKNQKFFWKLKKKLYLCPKLTIQ